MKRRASVQTVHLNLASIEDGVIYLTDGQARAVLEVSSVNFGLAGEGEREGIVASFAALLNGLTFPAQILVRVLPVDLEGPVSDLEHRAAGLSEPLAALAQDHAGFLRRLARQRTLLERRFYVVVPADVEGIKRRWHWLTPPSVSMPDHSAARKQLTFRCEELARGLGRCGLTARRMNDIELAHLYYTCWCPELSRVQRLRRALTEYTALVTQSNPTSPRRA